MNGIYLRRNKTINFFLSMSMWVGVVNCASAEIDLNERWVQNANGLWSLSITPRGTFVPLADKPNILRCYDPDVGGYCYGEWSISIRNGAQDTGKSCGFNVKIPKGTTYLSAMRLMQNQTIGQTCTLNNIQLNGNEKICIASHGNAVWSDGSAYYPVGVYFYGSTWPCQGGGSGGGEVTPPIDPVSCTIDSILIDHGSIGSYEINQSKASVQKTLNCTQKATVRMNISNNGKIRLNNDGSLYSIISINGVDGGSTVLVDKNAFLDFVSTLHYKGDGKISGKFTNSSVLSIDIQ